MRCCCLLPRLAARKAPKLLLLLFLAAVRSAAGSSRALDEAANALVVLQGKLLEVQSTAKEQATVLYGKLEELEGAYEARRAHVLGVMTRDASQNALPASQKLSALDYGLAPNPNKTPGWAVMKSQEKAFVQFEHAAAACSAVISSGSGLRRRLAAAAEAAAAAAAAEAVDAAVAAHAALRGSPSAAAPLTAAQLRSLAVSAALNAEAAHRAAVRAARCVAVQLRGQPAGAPMANRMGTYLLSRRTTGTGAGAGAGGGGHPVFELRSKEWATAYLYYLKGYWVVGPHPGSKAINVCVLRYSLLTSAFVFFYLLTHSLARSLARSLTHSHPSLTRSLTHSLLYVSPSLTSLVCQPPSGTV